MLKFVTLLSLVSVALCGDAEDAQPLADANTDFALRFYEKVAAKADNMIFSPYSISTALAMASSGAVGETLTEIYDALGYTGKDESDVFDMSMKLLKVLNADGNKYNMSVANKLFGEETFTFKDNFLDRLRDSFDTTLDKLNFKMKPEPARETINDWVEEVTNDKIKDLLPQGSVTKDTVLYLVNAIYFGAIWMNQFEKEDNIENEDFHISNTKTEKVTYMYREGKSHNYGYADLAELDAKLLELPYTDTKVSMYVLLPNAVEGLSKLEDDIKASDFSNSNANNIFSKLSHAGKVNVHLPKFEMTLPIQAKEVLVEMGMMKAFTDRADFSRIAEASIAISGVVHKAFINVHEAGTEAAAATAIGFATTSLDMSDPKEFYADHPFMYFIREKTTGSILFLGRYVAPPGEGGELPRVGEVNYQVNDGDAGSASFISASFVLVLFCVIGGLIALFPHPGIFLKKLP